MAIYRNVQMSFWTDTKIMDDFAPEEKYIYLYLLTNPHTNLCGCYEISLKQMAYETGMTAAKVKGIISKLQNNQGVVTYAADTKEVLLRNWHKYNWTSSDKFRKPLFKEIEEVKSNPFKEYLSAIYNGIDTVSDMYRYGIDTTDTVPDTDTVSDTDKNKRGRETQIDMFNRLIIGRAVSRKMESKLREWIQYKTERKEQYKETGMNALITKAVNTGAACGGDAVVKAIDDAMSSGYKGIQWDRCRGDPRTSGFNNNHQREYDGDLELRLLATN